MNENEEDLEILGVPVEGSGWPEGDKIVKEMLDRCKQSEALLVIDELIEHVRTMGISSNFSKDRYAGQSLATLESNPPIERIDIVYGKGAKLNERGHKRAVLLTHLTGIKSELLSLFSKLGSVRLNIEAANREPDGTTVQKPSEEDLAEYDTYNNS